VSSLVGPLGVDGVSVWRRKLVGLFGKAWWNGLEREGKKGDIGG
jgi:hypothetical protein